MAFALLVGGRLGGGEGPSLRGIVCMCACVRVCGKGAGGRSGGFGGMS